MAEQSEKKPDPYVELANRNLHSPYGFDRLEFLPQLRGKRQAELYAEMVENDALIGGVMFAIEMVLRQVEWHSEPADETPEGLERADFLATCKDDMSHTWEEFIADVLTMIWQGWSYLETVYKRRETDDLEAPAERRSKHPDGKIGWRKFVLVPQQTVDDWDLDEFGGVRALIQGGAYGSNRVRIPIEKALLFRTTNRSPQGKSVLRRVIESWYYRKRIREVEGIGIERDLAGLPVFYLADTIMANASRRAEYEAIIRNLRRDEQEGVILPAMVREDGSLEPIAKLELLSSGGQRQFNTTEIIGRYNREITMSLLQDVLLLGHEKVGTQALASEKRDLSDTALQAWLNDIAAVINAHAVPRLFALNGMPLVDLPKLKPRELRPTDVEEFFEALKNASSAGFVFDGDPDAENEVRSRLGLPPVTADTQRADEEPKPEPPMPTDNEDEGEEPTDEQMAKAAWFAKAHSGAMVALFLDPDSARAMAVEGGEPAADLHVTLAFLGDAGDLEDAERLRDVVRGFAATCPPIEGTVAGHGTFTAGPEPVTYASPDLPGLPGARERLVEALTHAGFAPSGDHGFTPHITLAYADVDADVDERALRFDAITLALGDEREDFPLTGMGADGP